MNRGRLEAVFCVVAEFDDAAVRVAVGLVERFSGEECSSTVLICGPANLSVVSLE